MTKICPLSNSKCLEANCQWWIEAHGITPNCAIVKIARDHVIAGQFDEDVEAAREAALSYFRWNDECEAPDGV